MSKTRKFLLIVLGAAVLLTVLVQQNAEQEAARAKQQRVAALTPAQRAAEEAEKAKRNGQFQQAGAGALALKRSMKDPEAFELKSLVLKPNGTACYEYRAKNSFGAIFPGSAVLADSGKLLLQERDGNAFVKIWNRDCTPAGGDEIGAFVAKKLLGARP